VPAVASDRNFSCALWDAAFRPHTSTCRKTSSTLSGQASRDGGANHAFNTGHRPQPFSGMDFQQISLAVCGATAAYILWKRRHSLSIGDVPGPKNPSWIHGIHALLCFKRRLTDSGTGHLWWWQHEEGTVVEKRLLEEYGTVARWNGTLGVRFLLYLVWAR
jgi:hypothetical protein